MKSKNWNDKKYNIGELQKFFEYWTEKNANSFKMRFEKEKVFCINRRLSTWRRKSLIWNKTPDFGEKLPNYFNKTFWQKASPDLIKLYKAHLFSIGWTYTSSPGGTFWQSPEGKLIWL